LLDVLLESNENGNLMTDTNIREEVDTFMFEVKSSGKSQSKYLFFFSLVRLIMISLVCIFRYLPAKVGKKRKKFA
jgi:hypothetical protein